MGYIFISYSHKDKDYIHRLQDALQAEGFEVWIDDRIDYGDEWPMVIQDRLDSCDAFIVVASENSYQSKWVHKEVTRAQRINKPFFPLLLSGNPWLSIESTQYVDVKDKSLPPEKFYKRLSSVTSRNKPLPAPPSPREESKSAPASRIANPTYAKPAPKFDFRLLSVGGMILIVLILGAFGINYFTHVSTTPKPSQTAQATSTFELPTETPEPPTETSTATLVPLTPTLGIGSTMISDKDGMKLLYVPAGNFLMGSINGDSLAFPDEKPQHTVYLDAFWIDQTDVTNAMYAKCVSAGACTLPVHQRSNTHSTYYGDSQFDNYPVIYVDWNMASVYCKWAGRQLPTEAQWEKAARGMDGRIYPWGNDSPDPSLLNYNGSNVGDTSEVGKYPNGASIYGALDMAGNVQEWVNDWYQKGYYATLGNNASNPQGPSSGDGRVLRGGTFEYSYITARSAHREWYDPLVNNDMIGFRCARSQ